MKRDNIIYWTATALVCLMGAVPGFMYFSNPMFVEGFHHLGFPDYFRIELASGKVLGLFLLLIPQIPARIKEWTYAAFGIVFISAGIAHFNVDGVQKGLIPLLPLSLLVVSYIFYHRVYDAKKAAA